ncbi:glutamate-rich protein 6 isoform X3 [Oncorhynchus keta]|uniref:glutamate-rich protein 6 isoform X3 n=2 Tax=Oncorhynchus keta TaxID=8018 RepID=UPI0015F890F8|nr:glutamate-rich protein 6 isoform X3 [Oncorhynchus keta]
MVVTASERTWEIMEAEVAGAPNQGWHMDGDVTTLPSEGKKQVRDTETDESSRLEQEPNEVFLLMDDHGLQDEYVQSFDCPPTPTSGFLGVLRYKRESQDQAPNPRNILPEPLVDSPVMCEYCGEKARPPLGPTFAEDPGIFCCAQYQQLCDMLAHERLLALQRPDQEDDATLPPNNQPTREELQARDRAEHRKQEQERERLYQDTQSTLRSADTYTPFSRTISYQLSTCTAKEGQWTVTQHPGIEEDLEKENGDTLYDHESFEFGISPHQDGAQFLEKYYACGSKFLTVFPDGSAQVFYPSGFLALVIISDGRERVCIVHDDHSLGQPIRALFQSDGRATCYHGNGTVWLSLDASGGQCLNDAGARIRRWRWRGHSQTPTPLRPLFLSLNRSLGVRVLGQEHMFVSFLSAGQQAKFSVGACLQPVALGMIQAPGPSISKEECILLAGRIRVHQVIRHLHHCLRCPSNPRPLRAGLAPSFLSLAKRLLAFSCSLQLEERERAFVHRCLQDCL